MTEPTPVDPAKSNDPKTSLPTATSDPEKKCPENCCCIPYGPFLVAFVVVVIALVASYKLPGHIRNCGEPHQWAQLLVSEMSSNLALQASGTNLPGVSLSMTNPAAIMRLQEQMLHISSRAEEHFEVMQYFYTNYYVQLLLGSIFAGLAAVGLVVLTKGGSEKASGCLISYFLSTTVCATFFFAFPNWCKTDENVTKNKTLYVKYIGLLTDARSYRSIGKFSDTQSTNTYHNPEDFILYLDKEMKNLNDIAVAFDASKYPIFKISTDR